MLKHLRVGACSLITVSIFSIPVANASCGSAFCPVNTQWDVQGVWTEPGLRFDLRYEHIAQKQPRHGRSSVEVGEIHQHHDEVETINNNYLATLDYAFNRTWGVSLSAPVVERSHRHLHNHHGAVLVEDWDFAKIGDMRLSGRYQKPMGKFEAVGLTFGLKLPTGDFNVSNSEGDVAERSLQPGTGTTDLLIGPFIRLPLSKDDSVFSQLLLSKPLNERDGYEPGEQVVWDIGYRHALTEKISGLVQLNFNYKLKDSGEEAEPESSGSRSINFSPGLSYTLTENALLYGYGQIPLYQYVNGVQLTEDWAIITGVSFRF